MSCPRWHFKTLPKIGRSLYFKDETQAGDPLGADQYDSFDHSERVGLRRCYAGFCAGPPWRVISVVHIGSSFVRERERDRILLYVLQKPALISSPLALEGVFFTVACLAARAACEGLTDKKP